MSIHADCPSCTLGNHDKHVRGWNIRRGLIGGSHCACQGDCAQRANRDFEELMARAENKNQGES